MFMRLLRRLRVRDRHGSCKGSGNRRGGGSSLAPCDGGGDVDSGPDDISDGIPHDDFVALHRNRRATGSEEGTGQSKGLGDGSHCKESWLVRLSLENEVSRGLERKIDYCTADEKRIRRRERQTSPKRESVRQRRTVDGEGEKRRAEMTAVFMAARDLHTGH